MHSLRKASLPQTARLKKGIHFNRIAPFYPNQVPLVWHIVGGHGATLVKVFEKECKKKGIPIYRKTRATTILADEEGKISGIKAVKEGGEVHISVKCIIIATGGFAMPCWIKRSKIISLTMVSSGGVVKCLSPGEKE